MVKDFLPISKKDMKKRGWEQCDFVYVIGDAYVDHSSFGPAIISRLLEAFGYKVGIIAQPDWKDKNRCTAAGISGICGQYGFHGQPLHSIQKAPQNRFFFTGRCYGQTTGLCDGGVLQPDPADL